MRYDESVTYLLFVHAPWREAVSTYTYPNNHVFHTLIAKAAVSVFGNSPAVLRLPAFIAGILVVPATYAAARALYCSRAALIATAIVASSGMLILYSTNARGYTMVVLAFLLLVISGARLLRGAPASHWLVFAVVGAFGMWTIPTMLYPLGAVALWLGLSLLVDGRAPELRRLGAALLIAAILTLLLYGPIISHEGFAALARNKFVVASNWFEFLSTLPANARETLDSWGLGLVPLVPLLLGAIAFVGLVRHADASSFPVGLPLATFVFSAWLLVVNHRVPFARVWMWMVPLVAALVGVGVLALAKRRERLRLFMDVNAPALAVGFAVAATASVLFSRAVLLSLDTGTYRDASEASELLARVAARGDRIVMALPTTGPLAYYSDRGAVSPDVFVTEERNASRVFAIVNEPERQTLDAVTARSLVRDTSMFGPPRLVSRLPSSAIYMYTRRVHAPR